MDPFDDDVLAEFDEYEETGNGLTLLQVFRRSAQYGIPAPYPAYRALTDILESYHSGEARTLDEAFNVKRPRNWNQSAARERSGRSKVQAIPGMSKISCLWYRAQALHADGMKKDGALWDALASEFHVSPSRAQQWYYEIEGIVKGKDG